MNTPNRPGLILPVRVVISSQSRAGGQTASAVRPHETMSPEMLLDASLRPEAQAGSMVDRARALLQLAREMPQMVIVGETSCQRSRIRELPALDLYEGSCFAPLRARVGSSLLHRRRIFVLTTRYGLVGANEPLRPYEPIRFSSDSLKRALRRPLHGYLALCPVQEMLLLLPTHYLDVLPRVTGHVGEVHTVVDPVGGWPQAAGLLDRWGWP